MSKEQTRNGKTEKIADAMSAEELAAVAAVLADEKAEDAAEHNAEPEENKEQNDAPEKSRRTEDEDAQVKDKNKSEVGKFRNPEELMRAYNELEKEFTRRSQRLAEAERKLKEKDAPFNPDEEEWKATVDKFFERTPSAKPFAKDMARELMAHPELRRDANCLNNALTRVLVAKFRTPEQMLQDGQFLNDYVLTSTAVKAAVIEGYLKGLKDGKPPVVMQGTGELGVTPRKNPKSIEEAGNLFLKDNK